MAGFTEKSLGPERSSQLPFWAPTAVFLVLTILFSCLSQRAAARPFQDPIVHTPTRSAKVRMGNSEVCCFCGSIHLITDVDLIVTSENQHLTLGSPGGISVSSRVRQLAAERDDQGRIASDLLEEYVSAWKSGQGHFGPYELGTTIECPPFRMELQGVRGIMLAVALQKGTDGVNKIDRHAIHKILRDLISYAQRENFEAVFVPIFGLGSGAVEAETAIRATIEALKFELQAIDCRFSIDLGTYRMSDAARTISVLAELGDR